MQESKAYQLLTERITKEITIEYILVVLKTKFPTELVDALAPALQKIASHHYVFLTLHLLIKIV